MAKAADIGVVLGMESLSWVSQAPSYPEGLNAIVAAFGAQNNIPVINYDFALSVVGSSPYLGPARAGSPGIPALSTLPCWLSAEDPDGGGGDSQYSGAGTRRRLFTEPYDGQRGRITSKRKQHNYGIFTPVHSGNGRYNNNPLVAPFVNSTFAGSTATCTSSNPLVLYVTQSGVPCALTPGTAAITNTAPTGVKFNEWVMNVSCLDCTP